MRKIAIICLLASISVLVSAQSIAITPEVTSLDERAVVEYGKMIHATEGATVIYRVKVEKCDFIDSVATCQYTFNNVKHEAIFTLNNGVITINKISVPMVVGSNRFSFKLIIQERGKKDLTELKQEATIIQIYPVPTHYETSTPLSLIFYKETGELSWTAHGEGGAKWEYVWTSTEKKTGNDATFVHSSITNNGAAEKKVIVTLSATNYAPDGVTKWDSYSEEWAITVLPISVVNLSVSPNTEEEPCKKFQGDLWNLAVSTKGGNSEGWKIEWINGDNNIILSQGLEYKVTSSRKDIKETKHIILHVTNKAPKGINTDDGFLYNNFFHYYVCFYPTPIIEFTESYPQNVLDGEKIQMGVKCKDAATAEDYVINCEWNGNGKANDSYLFEAVNSGNMDGIQNKITVRCSFGLINSDVKSDSYQELSHTFTVWPLPQVNATNLINRVGCGGQSFESSIITTGGKKDGWSYVWTLNDQNINANSNTCILTLDNSSTTDSIVNHYKVRATNICDNVVWFNEDFSFTVIVYPEPKVPERIIVMDVNRGVEVSSGIREGNNLFFHCDECIGGYPNAWSYKWIRNNSIFGIYNEVNEKVSSNYSGNGKADDMLIEYDCVVENTYDIVSWKKQEYKKEIRVYRKPQTPIGLQKKGNGSSGTWVATCSLDDASLGINDYYLVFGYQDADGKMHDVSTMRQQNVGEQRWSCTQTAFNGNAYVYALWKYDDGSEVTSGLCMESSVDENWDGSTYDGSTRSVIDAATGINEIPFIQTQENAEYYSPDGIKNNQLKRGLNIVRTQDGHVVKIINNK